MFRLPKWCFQCCVFIHDEIKSLSPYLCRNCFQNLPFIKKHICFKCGGGHSSDNCREEWPEYISGFKAVCTYQKPVRQWISALKYSRNLIAGRVLRDILTQWFYSNHNYLTDIDFIVPVPVHHFRLRQRGFNQTEYLLNQQSQLLVKNRIIKKIRHTPHQAGLSRSRRRLSLKKSFRSVGNPAGKTVLLFDDVCTSGGTLGEISKCLKQAGAERIKVLVLSRAV